MDSTKYGENHTRIGADIIKKGFRRILLGVSTRIFFENCVGIFFSLFSYINYSMVIRKRIPPNSGQIIPE